jgi:hypothetical protein
MPKKSDYPLGFMTRDMVKKYINKKLDEEEMENKLKYIEDYNYIFNERDKKRKLESKSGEKSMDKKIIIAKVIEKISKAMPKPPKKWWDTTLKDIMKSNPDYTKEIAQKVVGDIWFNQLTNYRRKKIIKES